MVALVAPRDQPGLFECVEEFQMRAAAMSCVLPGDSPATHRIIPSGEAMTCRFNRAACACRSKTAGRRRSESFVTTLMVYEQPPHETWIHRELPDRLGLEQRSAAGQVVGGLG